MDCICRVKLIRPMDVSDFVATASSCPKEIEIIASHGKYDVDARSTMGMFSLNLSEPVTLRVNIPDTETDFDEKAFLKSLKEWSV